MSKWWQQHALLSIDGTAQNACRQHACRRATLRRSLLQLVHDKERGLRMMMKMHGLSDGAYWAATTVWMALF